MNLNQVKGKLYDITNLFFQGATVLWAEQSANKPEPPYVTLKTSGISKTFFPVVEGEASYYSCSTIWEVNLYTKGKQVVMEERVSSDYENTALSDMGEFVFFLESPALLDLFSNDLDIQLIPPIRDLTALLNDTKYRYRAMAEFTVSYTEKVTGRYHLSNAEMIPNSSGGGTKKQKTSRLYTINRAEIKEETDL